LYQEKSGNPGALKAGETRIACLPDFSSAFGNKICSRDRCYNFKNIFAENFADKIGGF
jgi:hypothetical protein